MNYAATPFDSNVFPSVGCGSSEEGKDEAGKEDSDTAEEEGGATD